MHNGKSLQYFAEEEENVCKSNKLKQQPSRVYDFEDNEDTFLQNWPMCMCVCVHTRAEMALDVMGIHHPRKQWGCLAFELSGALDPNTHTPSRSPFSLLN